MREVVDGRHMYSFEARVRYSECDETGRLSLVSAMNYLQDCSTFQSATLGFDATGGTGALDPVGDRLMWVLADWLVEVDELPRFGERIEVSTWCYEMTRAHALRCFEIRSGGRSLLRADSQWFVVDALSGHATRVPEGQRAFVSGEPRLGMGPRARRLRAEGEGAPAPERPVTHQDLDTNRHVNNARYVGLALDALEAVGHEAPVGRLQVQYRSMALLDDVVVPVVHPCEGGWDVDLTDGAGRTYALVRLQAAGGAGEKDATAVTAG